FVSRLPRSGEWIRTLRVLIGLLEVAAAIKFISNADLVLRWGVFTREAVLSIWIALALIGVAYLLVGVGRRVSQRELPMGRIAAAAVALLIAIWLTGGLGGKALPQVEAFLPPRVPVPMLASNQESAPEWMLNDYDGALNAARNSGKLIFVDFTGYTC